MHRGRRPSPRGRQRPRPGARLPSRPRQASSYASAEPTVPVTPGFPALPDTSGTIDGCHDAGITPETIIPAWYGERLDLDYAIYTCFANAEYHARQRDQARQHDQAGPPDQPAASTTAPQDQPWTPAVTEVDLIAAIGEQSQRLASTGHG